MVYDYLDTLLHRRTLWHVLRLGEWSEGGSLQPLNLLLVFGAVVFGAIR